MTQRSAVLLAFALTVFVLVLVGGVIATVTPEAADAREVGVRSRLEAPATTTPTEGGAAGDARGLIGGSDAAAIARSAVGGANLTRAAELVDYRGTLAYEVLLDRATVYVDATNGEVIEVQPAIDPADAQFARETDRAGRDRDDREHRGEYWDDEEEDDG